MAELEPARLNCPACNAPILLPLTQAGADLTSITLAIDLTALRRHIATAHPQEPYMSAFTDKLKSFFSRFAEVSHEELVKVEQAVEEKVRPMMRLTATTVRSALVMTLPFASTTSRLSASGTVTRNKPALTWS